jgi:hypothetical protein
MTLRAADLRFALPHSVTTATVVEETANPAVRATADGLRAAGVLCGRRTEPVDLVVASAENAQRALALPGRSHLLLGRADPRAVRSQGRSASQIVVLGEPVRPAAVVPSASRGALSYYLTQIAAPVKPRRRLRNRAAAGLVGAGLPVSRFAGAPHLATVVVSDRDRGAPPHLVAAAQAAGVPAGAGVDWVLTLGRGDDLQRAVFHLLEHGRVRWVVKFSRVRGATDAFDRDEIGLGLARSAGEVVAAHAPALLTRVDVDGLPASVETAAAGRPLLERLPRRPRSLIDSIARWVVDMGVATVVPPEGLVPERNRLARDVVPAWVSHGAPTDLLLGLPPVPGVLQHNDLGSWNIVSDGRDFTAVDWESARSVGMPLWDLLYLLADALVRMEGPADVDTMVSRCLELFRGGSPYSPTLFGWIQVAVARLGIPTDVVGPLATLCWMHHGLSAARRQSALEGAPPAELGHLARLAGPWLADPDLGPTWSCWRAR